MFLSNPLSIQVIECFLDSTNHSRDFLVLISFSYYSWACSSAVFAWKRGIWVIVLKCLCIKYSNVLAISDSFCRLWSIAEPMDAPIEVTRWDARTYRGKASLLSYGEGRHHWTFEHALLWKNMLLEVCLPVLFVWVHYFRCWSHMTKRLTFMRFHMETAELQAQP